MRPFPTYLMCFFLMILFPFLFHQIHGIHKVTFVLIGAFSFLLQGLVAWVHGWPFALSLISPAICTLLLYSEWPEKSQQLGNWNIQLALHMILWYIPSFVVNGMGSMYFYNTRLKDTQE
ncbi:MAG: hypothetical protein NXH75_16765 [Halobacteriovoraceae bacterium]|nr:hypothetical protein [Halobacteriovoraceae bacterium]